IAGVFMLFLKDALTEQKLRGCLTHDEFTHQGNKLLRRAGRHNDLRAAPAVSAASCQDFTHMVFSSELKNRSLSPWRSKFVKDQHLIPSVYEEAECLCSGCIINGFENTDYNSVPVMRETMFLKKVPCPADPQKYSINIVYKTLPVACTCVVP
ncbi:interleukin-17C precursor, partial [Silurus asotus]